VITTKNGKRGEADAGWASGSRDARHPLGALRHQTVALLPNVLAKQAAPESAPMRPGWSMSRAASPKGLDQCWS